MEQSRGISPSTIPLSTIEWPDNKNKNDALFVPFAIGNVLVRGLQ